MKTVQKFIIALLLMTSLFFMYLIQHQHSTVRLHENSSIDPEVSKLLDLITLQNKTILLLQTQLSKESAKRDENKNILHENHLQSPLTKLTIEEDKPIVRSIQENEIPTVSSSSSIITSHELNSKFESECDGKYGEAFISNWRDSKQIWCEDETSSLICYPYHQAHKKLDGRGPDLFCEARDFVIDFAKVHGDHASDSKPALGSQYLNFDSASLLSSCKKTNYYNDRLFMPHQSFQFRSFRSEAELSENFEEELTTTYLLARDEDCENAFHSTADFMNMHLIQRILNLDWKTVQVMLFDKHPNGPFMDLINKAYCPKFGTIRHNHYSHKKVQFKRLIFHLESPAGLIFPKVSRPDPLRCLNTDLFQSYRRYILQSFELLDIPPPPIPTVTLILRHRTAKKNVGRVLENEGEVIKILKSGNMMKLNVVDLAQMKYEEQIKLIRNSNVIVGVHGAGLMNIMFAAEEAVLVEVHPSYRQDRHFRHASRMTGKVYMPLRSTSRETCVGSSDNVKVPIDEFSRAIDGALRIARQFDDGISECGLVCPKEILALDSRLDNFYTDEFRKGRSINTQFPCG